MGRFDWSASDGLFKKIVGAADEGEWVRRCNEALASLKDHCALEHREEILEGQPSQSGSEAEVLGAGTTTKRKRESSLVKQLAPVAKKGCRSTGEAHETKEQMFQRRAEECEIGV